MPNPAELRHQITSQIVAALEKGVVPWRRCWSASPNAGPACNVVSRRSYSGINVLLLQLHNLRHNLHTKWFATMPQWNALGGRVMKRPDHVSPGEWGCRIVFFKPFSKTVIDKDSGEEQERQLRVLRTYTVFNVEQVDGESLDKYRDLADPPGTKPWPDFSPADELIEATKADIRFGGDRACYLGPIPDGSWPKHAGGDFICLPHRHQFVQPGAFYETALHELCHWTEPRLSWDRKAHGYAVGELRAEMAACFTAAELHVPQGDDRGNHASYLKNWLRAMKADPSFLFQVSSQASQASDYLLAFVRGAEAKTKSSLAQASPSAADQSPVLFQEQP